MRDGAGSAKPSFRQPGTGGAADPEDDGDALKEARATRDAARLLSRAKEWLAATLEERQHGVFSGGEGVART